MEADVFVVLPSELAITIRVAAAHVYVPFPVEGERFAAGMVFALAYGLCSVIPRDFAPGRGLGEREGVFWHILIEMGEESTTIG
jgi:hypothetical protein